MSPHFIDIIHNSAHEIVYFLLDPGVYWLLDATGLFEYNNYTSHPFLKITGYNTLKKNVRIS